MAKLQPEFERRGVKLIGLSVDASGDHEKWANDIEETQGARPNYPIIADADFNVSKLYGMLPASTSGEAKSRTPADNQTVRNVFVIGPDKKIKLILVYPMTTGRNFDEVLRVIDSLQLTAKYQVSTPVNWKPGEDVIIAGSVSNDEAKQIFGDWKNPSPISRSFLNRARRCPRAGPRGRVRRPRAVYPASRRARGPGPRHPDRQERRLRLWLLETRRDVRAAQRGRGAPALSRTSLNLTSTCGKKR